MHVCLPLALTVLALLLCAAAVAAYALCLSLVSRSRISGALLQHSNTPPRRPTTDGAECTMHGHRRGFDRMARHTHAPRGQQVSTAILGCRRDVALLRCNRPMHVCLPLALTVLALLLCAAAVAVYALSLACLSFSHIRRTSTTPEHASTPTDNRRCLMHDARTSGL